MPRHPATPPLPRHLGLECGGTKTHAILADASNRILAEARLGPANFQLLSPSQLVTLFRAVRESLGSLIPDGIGIGMAGARTADHFKKICQAAARIWPSVPCLATNDLEVALAAAPDRSADLSVLVLSGTGSCCYGRARDGRVTRAGGWGHLLGDHGSGYHIGLRSLQSCISHFDHRGQWPTLGARLLNSLAMSSPDELIPWVHSAPKAEVAALAPAVFAAARENDRMAREILRLARRSLADDAAACVAKFSPRPRHIQFVLAGSVLTQQPAFTRQLSRDLCDAVPGSAVTTLTRPGAWGAIELARGQADAKPARVISEPPPSQAPTLKNITLSPTEMRHPGSMHLDRMSVSAGIRLMLGDDAKIPNAILAEGKKIERVVGWIANAFRRGGRLFYIGAGTSGRLGVLDASECPPTFRTSPDMVQGIIAGGQSALWKAVEGAEDDRSAGAAAVRFRRVAAGDVVVGIAASGRTPFVLGGLAQARREGARTVLLCFNPCVVLSRADRPGVLIAPNLGPEILTGSTRLKSGTATKLILNIFTTLAMVRHGKVMGNLMIDLNPSNVKLRDRAVRIIRALTGVDESTALRALQQSHWQVKKACLSLRPR